METKRKIFSSFKVSASLKSTSISQQDFKCLRVRVLEITGEGGWLNPRPLVYGVGTKHLSMQGFAFVLTIWAKACANTLYRPSKVNIL